MDDWEIIRDLIKALAPDEPSRYLLEEVFSEIADDVDEFEATLSRSVTAGPYPDLAENPSP